MDLSNIDKEYNLVNQHTKVESNYDLSSRQSSIKIYIDRKGNLIILGIVDNNYIYWASLTNTDDKELNEKIFNHIANDEFSIVSKEYLALKTRGIEYKDLCQWYSATLVRETKNNMAWKTPFGHYYGTDQINNNGSYFANDVCHLLGTLQSSCEFRECNGEYIKVLDHYRNLLLQNDDYSYYTQIKSLEEILQKEDYLKVSKNIEIRELYTQCMDIISQLYNCYMSAVR